MIHARRKARISKRTSSACCVGAASQQITSVAVMACRVASALQDLMGLSFLQCLAAAEHGFGQPVVGFVQPDAAPLMISVAPAVTCKR